MIKRLFKYTSIFIIIVFFLFITSCITPVIQEEERKPEESIEVTTEETKSENELKLEEISDEDLLEKIEQALDNAGITNDEERIEYIEKILELKSDQINIDYIFNSALEGYSLNEKIMLVEAFNEFELDDIAINKYIEIISDKISTIKFKSEQDRMDFIYNTLKSLI
ncbi:MAG: hypothetical protein H8E13_13690 [Actinobacteria bacterium]|nr:hypothetical protein [Actinomycetota bacterium]